jgi:hypothetical protein
MLHHGMRPLREVGLPVDYSKTVVRAPRLNTYVPCIDGEQAQPNAKAKPARFTGGFSFVPLQLKHFNKNFRPHVPEQTDMFAEFENSPDDKEAAN